MPLPFIPIAIALAATAVFGTGKTVKAVMDKNEAEDIQKKAQELVQRKLEELEKQRDDTEWSIESFAELKISVLEGNISEFVRAFSQIKNIDFRNSIGLDELKNLEFSENDLKDMKLEINLAKDLSMGVASGATAGALTAFGAYGGTMALASAGTGTAIGTLSGVAATNATLAWLGGGTLAAGGMGVAGGMMMLGGIVAAPALAIMGLIVGSKAEKALEDAKANRAKAEEAAEQIKTMKIMAKAIQERADMFCGTLVKLDEIFSLLVIGLESLVQTSVDYRAYTQTQKELVAKNVSLAQSIKAIIDMPILTKDGDLNDKAKELLDATNESYGIEYKRRSSFMDGFFIIDTPMVPRKYVDDQTPNKGLV